MPANELHRAASPYLLQHKDNPVHWMEWGEPALALARRSGKPILLSVGYAACHWCHVMASESFEDPATAEVMNELFVNIKVDREERPDVDHLYMSALHSLGEQGGWPLTMFLAPDGAPFWGGTYFPKTARFGRPAFTTVLKSVAAAFRDKPETVANNKTAILHAIATQPGISPGGPALTAKSLDAAAQRAASAMDPVNGGLDGAPKFPNASLIELLFRAGKRLRDPDITNLALLTLRRIAQGGIHDHLGGGFARYSVDARWLIPHFEKMLYDNAQLVDLLAFAYAETGESLFKARIAETIAWLRREMMADGAFAASLDADSEHVEGKFYVWSKSEVDGILGPDAALFCRAYDVTPEGNWRDEHTGQSVNILNRLDTPALTADEEVRLPALRGRLLEARARRVRPALDDKVLTDWNAFAVAALARAAGPCGEPEWLDFAREVFDVLVARLSAGSEGRLVHARRGERRGGLAFASDYAAMAGAALALAEARADDPAQAERDLARARRWLAILDEHYAAPDGALFMTTDTDRDIPARLAPLADEATPNANGVYAAALIRMAAMTGEEVFRERADRLFDSAAAAIMRSPLGHCALLNAFDLRLNGIEVVLAGREVGPLMEAALRLPALNRILTTSARLSGRHIVHAQEKAAGAGAAFLCRDQACSAPIRDPARLRLAVEALQSGAPAAA